MKANEIVIIALSPQRKNLTYYVRPQPALHEFANQLGESILKLRVHFPKTIVFCSRYQECSQLYQLLRSMLSRNFTEPPGYPDVHEFRIVDMYTRASLPEMKEKVLCSFSKVGSRPRLVIATTAFGMGIDCPDVREIVCYGLPLVLSKRSTCEKLEEPDVMDYNQKLSYCMENMADL